MKKRAIVTGGTKSDVAAMAVLAMNIRETNSHLFDCLVIYHDGIKKKDQKLIQSIYNTKFIKYEYPNASKNDVILTYFSPMVFCKYECFRLLDEFDTVVWTDYDVVIQDKLDKICEFDNSCFNIVKDPTTIREMFYKEIRNREIFNYDLNVNGFTASLFALSNSLDKFEMIYSWCYKKTKEWDEDIYLPEQCVLGLAAQEFHIKTSFIDGAIYGCHPRNAKGNEIILHAACQPKFWNGIYNGDWNRRYAEWLKMGGSPYNDRIKKIKNKWKLITSRIQGIRSRI